MSATISTTRSSPTDISQELTIVQARDDRKAITSPLLEPSNHETHNLGSLLPEIILRICLWLDHSSIFNFAAASRQRCLDIMGFEAAQLLLSEGGLSDCDLPLICPTGYNLLGRIHTICAFGIALERDFGDKFSLYIAEHENIEPNDRTERFFSIKKLAKYEGLQGADFSRLFNLITNGEGEASFSRPATGLTPVQRQRIKQIENGYRILNTVFVSLFKWFTQLQNDDFVGFELEPEELERVINSAREKGNPYVEDKEIEKILLQSLDSFIDRNTPPHTTPEKRAADKEAVTNFLTVLIRFSLGELSLEERTQLKETLEETFDIVKPIFGFVMKERFDQQEEVDQAERMAPEQQMIPAPPPIPVWGSRLVMQFCYGLGSLVGATYGVPYLLGYFPDVVLPFSETALVAGIAAASYIGLNLLTTV